MAPERMTRDAGWGALMAKLKGLRSCRPPVTSEGRCAMRGVRTAGLIAMTFVAALLAQSLEAQGRASEPAAEGRSITQWIAALGTSDITQKMKALATIKSMGATGVPALRSAAASDPNRSVRFFAINLLGGLGGRGVAPVLAAAVERDPDSQNRYAAATALDKLAGQGDTEAAAAIARLLPVFLGKLGDPSAASEASRVVTSFGDSANPALIRASTDRNRDIRYSAVLALADLKGPGVVAALVERLRDTDAGVRSGSALALGVLFRKDPSEAPRAVPALTAAVRDQDARVKAEAIEALGKIGPPARSAIPALTAALKDEDASVRSSAEEALARIRGPAKATTPR